MRFVLAGGRGERAVFRGEGGRMDCNLEEGQMNNVRSLVMEMNTGVKMYSKFFYAACRTTC